jgi:hypothetical protein
MKKQKLTDEQRAEFEQELADSHAVVAFEIVGPYTLHLTFDDGVEHTINFKPALWGEMMKPLFDLSFFNQVYMDDTGVLTWPNGADWNPAYLYRWPEYEDELIALAAQWHLQHA